MALKVRTLLLLCWLPMAIQAQVDTCGCEKKELNTICHLSVKDFCYNVDGCQHTLDGEFMAGSLALKLKNPKNFGSMGISECGINIKRMPPFSQAREIDDAGCDIFFVGSFAVDTLNYRINSDKTSVPNFMLEAIRSWSMACDRNLVVVAQAEAKPWGYVVQNKNVNPNTAISDPSKFSIFNGIFGSLQEFKQGGTYQGVITQQPSTGTEILAKDANGRPTVAFDVATKDLILGDIGILCGIAGFLSNGNQIRSSNDNDILAGNIFALGCKINQGTKFTEDVIYKCEGEIFTAPNGLVFQQPGIFVDKFVTDKGCDSLHYTKILDYKKSVTYFDKLQCKGDSSSYQIGNYTFNENFPTGTALFTDVHGCDSVINVRLNYFANTSYTFADTVCAESGFIFSAGPEIYSLTKPSGTTHIKNVLGCDSAIHVNILYIHADSTTLADTICYHDSLLYNNEYLFPDQKYKFRYPSKNPCDSIVTIFLESYNKPDYELESPIVLDLYGGHQFQNKVDEPLEIEWQNDPGLSCLNCPNPYYKPVEFSALLQGKIIDGFQCNYPFGIEVGYKCDPILPNIISTASQGVESEFRWTTQCPVKNFTMRIYDRWGNVMFHSSDATLGWNPTQVVPGVYTYVIEFEDIVGPQYKTGDITVVR